MLRKIKRLFTSTDYLSLGVAILLSVIGLFAIYSAGYEPSSGTVQNYYSRQIVWFAFGIVAFFIVSYTNYKTFIKFAPFLYFLGIILLFVVLLKGHVGMGAQRWIGFAGFRLQPSELFKVIWVITLGWIFINFDSEHMNILKIMKKVVLLAPPFLLVFLQPDLGTSMTYVAVWGCVVLFLGIKRFSFIFILVFAILFVPFMWTHMHDYQKKRVITFLNPESDPFGSGYHIIQSKIGVGSGGVNGKGYMKGTQAHLRFIPERHTDFIFSVINEEFGLIGGSVVIILFLILVLRIFNAGIRLKEPSGKIICIAVAFYIIFQFVINSYMIVGMMPVVGIPMPFLSYGGSSIITFFIMLGLLNSVYLRRYSTDED